MLQNRNLSLNDKKRLLLLATREIEKKDDLVNIKGEKRRIDEKNLAPGMMLPYRIVPGNISVRNIFKINIIILFIIGCKKYWRF